ncbi:MAG: MFS transporter [Armatimonadetes bacterium]|nr:MFS transporter [Armatimonadota bacterium]
MRYRDFRLWFAGSVITTLGTQMFQAAVGWELYGRTHSAMALAYVGLVQIIPVVALFLPAGHLADRVDRRLIILCCQLLLTLGSIGLALISYTAAPVALVYGCLLLMGIAQAFYSPARSAMLPQLLPLTAFNNAATWSSGGFQMASSVGPGLAGIVIGLTGRATPVYLLDAVSTMLCFGSISLIASRHVKQAERSFSLRELGAGLRFVWQTREIFGAIALDMFAVLLGGATTLLPIFATDILHVGPVHYGWLRASPAIGASVMAVSIAIRPPLRRAGRSMLLAVAGFGVATIVFGLSRNFWLSFVMLFLTGAFDNISVVFRQTLVQVRTPDSLRGRVSAVNGVFIGTSNQFGEFESGVVARFFGAVFSAVAGGVGTIIVVTAATFLFPELRHLGSLRDLKQLPEPSRTKIKQKC